MERWHRGFRIIAFKLSKVLNTEEELALVVRGFQEGFPEEVTRGSSRDG